MYVSVKVRVGAKREVVKEMTPERFEVSVREPAEQNAANGRVVALLAAQFNVPTKSVRIIKGHKQPSKLLAIDVQRN